MYVEFVEYRLGGITVYTLTEHDLIRGLRLSNLKTVRII